jgi:hypothetical protein
VIVLAHGAQGPFDELILVVPAVVLLFLAVVALRRRNRRRLSDRRDTRGTPTST